MFKQISAAAALAIAGAAVPMVASSPANAAPRRARTAVTCATGTWSSTAQGRPAGLAPGAAQGLYMWHDGDGWHVRVTHPGTTKVVFTGTIDSGGTGPFDVAAKATESADLVSIQPLQGKIKFRMQNKGKIDGFDFKVGCVKRFTVEGRVDAAPIANNQVFLGAGASAPLSVPFTMERS